MVDFFEKLKPFKALVIGDFLLDTYTIGRVHRISPEAPVPVMEVQREDSRPGGAGNAVLNLLALGGSVVTLGRIGPDLHGAHLRERLQSAGAIVETLLTEPNYSTPVKNRLIADSQQLLRVDFETIVSIDRATESLAISHLEKIIPTVQVVAISDYGKGFLSKPLLREAIRIAKNTGIPMIVDPKGDDFTKYQAATLLKPNLSEAYAAANMTRSTPLEQVAKKLLEQTDVEHLLITRSEAGMSLFGRQGIKLDFPVRSREVKDVTGAGDTVLAILGLAMANHLDLSFAVQLANIAASIAIERLGCIQVSLADIAERFLELEFHTKIFDKNHTHMLQQALKGKRSSLLILEKGQLATAGLFSAIRKLKQENSELLVYLDGSKDDALLHSLSSLHDIRAIISQKETLTHLADVISNIFSFEQEELRKTTLRSS